MQFSIPEYWSGKPSHPILDRVLPNPGTEPRSPALQADSVPAEPQGKSKNTGVSSLSLLQQIFHTQELNWGLLHCRQILYQLSHQEGPIFSSNNLKVHVCSVMSDSVNPWIVALQASLSIECSKQEYWSGLPFPFPEDLSNPGI